MKTIHFKGQDYDPEIILKRLIGQGQRVTLPTKDIIDTVSFKAAGDRVVAMYQGKYHLLTGQLDANTTEVTVVLLSNMVLKKALRAASTYADRREEQLARRPNVGSSFGFHVNHSRQTFRGRGG